MELIQSEIEKYAQEHTRPEPELLQQLAVATYAEMDSPTMLTGRLEGRLLKLLAQLCGAKRVLEIGTFTGYSALSVAEGLPGDGKVITCEIDPKHADFARRYIARSPHGGKIEIRMGPALETLKSLAAGAVRGAAGAGDAVQGGAAGAGGAVPGGANRGGTSLFDMAFIDADKSNYPAYYEAVVDLIRPGGLILVDNTLWSGNVLNPRDEESRAIAALNRRIAGDERVENVLLTVRDGVQLVRKRT